MTVSTIRDSSNHERPQLTPVILGLIVSILSGIVAVIIWKARHEAAFILLVSGIGLSMGPLLVLYGAVNRRWKSLAHKLILLAGGATGLIFSSVLST